MRRIGLTAGVCLIASLGVADSAGACSCVGPGAIYEDSARLAFTGRLLAKEEASNRDLYMYRVTRVFKTSPKADLAEGDDVTLPVSLIESCGFPQVEGERYGVMAVKYRRGEDVQASGCTMTSAEELRKSRCARDPHDQQARAAKPTIDCTLPSASEGWKRMATSAAASFVKWRRCATCLT